ncbi:HMG box protein [Colletotrichum paranaense]|uniref:HMG box protein n=2 Tax=Colletotrichum acutatum species complex TaxID=2707335 RepID=A0AAI9UPE7_9PEZI|nr:HMG box protein [Colletotrichum paranaense]KAK1462239.1 HMG box protein [Colletotrichum melonis]KAK1545638.1 HMG box protein [Colletotrichum paranaense]
MPPKKIIRANPPAIDLSAIPPSLPPSVEEAYRRKCIQLKQRTGEVEEENDATRVRLARIRRQIEKLRMERAFLLEQLAKRTSANVEDSDGSPSPPPTVGPPPSPPRRQSRMLTPSQPQEKPLRTKRGHRKPSVLAEIDSAAKANSRPLSQTAATVSPSSETFSHTQGADATQGTDTQATARTNGVAKPPKRPGNAFEMYCADTRPVLEEKNKDDADANIEEELARGWKDLPEGEKEEFQTRSEEEMAKYQKEKDAFAAKSKSAEAKDEDEEERDKSPEPAPAASQDEDVEMTNYDTEEQADDTPAADDKDDKADD